MYTPRHPARTHSLALRQGHYFLRSWGSAASEHPLLLLLHGWMDVGASFQFMVDALPPDWLAGRHVVALDWRGFGHTRMPACDHYLFADYLADLDALLEQLSPQQPVDLLGHSMGANVAMLYAGVRPQRVRRLVNLEGFGLPASPCERAPDHLARWLDALQARRQGSLGLRSYASVEQVAQRLRHNNPRLPQAQAEWLALQWAAPAADGRWHVLADEAHKLPGSERYDLDEVLAIWRRIRAPLLMVEASDDEMARYWQGRYTKKEFEQRLLVLGRLQRAQLEAAGHMLHHDQPAALAALLIEFLDSSAD